MADGSGSIAFKNDSIGRTIHPPQDRSRLANFIENCRQLYVRFDRLWFFGEKARIDTRSPKDGIPTLDLLENMLDPNFYSSSTYTDAIGPVFEELCKSDDTNPTVLLIMTDGMINDTSNFSRLVHGAVRQIPLGKRCGLVHIVLWIALHVSQPEREKIRIIYTDLQNQIKDSAITLHCLYEDDCKFALLNLIEELLKPVATIPSDCIGLPRAFWKKDTPVSAILNEVNDLDNYEHGIEFVQELAKFVESLLRAGNFPESDLYAMIYRLLSSFRKSPNQEIVSIATQIMDKISAQKQSGTNRAFWDKVTADSTAVSGSRDLTPALKLVSDKYMFIPNLHGHMATMADQVALGLRDASNGPLIGFYKNWYRDPVVAPIDEMPENLGMPIVLPAFYHHDPVIARDMMSNLFRSFGLPHLLQGSALFATCLFFVYTDIQVPPGVRDACLTVIKDYKWIQSIIFEPDGTTLKPFLLAPAFAPLMYAAMKDIDFGSSSMEMLKRMHRVSFALNKARSTTVGPLEVNISSGPSGLRASKGDIILLTLLAWGSTQNPMPKIPDFVRVKGFSKDGRMIIIWLDNGSEFRMEIRPEFYIVVAQNVPDDVVRIVRELMEGWRREDVPESVSARKSDQAILGARTNQILDILKTYGPKPRSIDISNEVVMRVLREAFPALFGVQGSHMERCKQLAEGTRFLEPLPCDKLVALNIIVDGAQLPTHKIDEIIQCFLRNCELQCTQSSTEFTCSSCVGEYPVGCGYTMCGKRHMVCSECFNGFKETITFRPGSVINSAMCTCWICRDKWPDITLAKLELMTSVENFIRSPPPRHELNVFKICSVDKCCSIFEAGPKYCADDGAELPSECEAHRKQTSFSCPTCQMQYQYVTGCTLIRCCLHPNEYGQRGYHSCRNDDGEECNHCLDPDCDEERCSHTKGCGHVFRIGAAELQIGN
jgi:hypothetical protein